MLLGLMFSSYLLAQDDSVSFKYRTYSLNGEIEAIQCGLGNGAKVLDVPNHIRSDMQKYRGSRIVRFYDPKAVSALTTGEKPSPIGEVKVSGDAKHILFLFNKQSQPDGALRYDVYAINDDPSAFSNGSMKFLNLTGHTLYFVLGAEGKENFVIKADQFKDYKLPADFTGNLPVKVAVKNKGKFVVLMHSRIFPSQKARDFYFIWPKENAGKGHKVRISQLRENASFAKQILAANQNN